MPRPGKALALAARQAQAHGLGQPAQDSSRRDTAAHPRPSRRRLPNSGRCVLCGGRGSPTLAFFSRQGVVVRAQEPLIVMLDMKVNDLLKGVAEVCESVSSATSW